MAVSPYSANIATNQGSWPDLVDALQGLYSGWGKFPWTPINATWDSAVLIIRRNSVEVETNLSAPFVFVESQIKTLWYRFV